MIRSIAYLATTLSGRVAALQWEPPQRSGFRVTGLYVSEHSANAHTANLALI